MKKKKQAITDLNAPKGSRDIPFQSQEFGQRNFASFQILLLWQPESKLLSIIEKTKGVLFKQK